MKFFIFIIFSFLRIFTSHAQNIENTAKQKPIAFSGSLAATSNLYYSSDTNSHRIPLTNILSGNFNISVYGINMPFSFMYSNNNFNYAQPFNRIGISPEYKWIKLHLGYREVAHTSFTLAGHTFLGAGVEMNPGKLRFSSVYGRFKKKTVPNTINPLDTLFSPTRKGYSVKLGYGNERNYFDFVFLKITDDTLTNHSSKHEAPQGNMVIGTQFKISFSNNISWETEGAYSLLTKDMNLSSKLDTGNKALQKFNSLFTINETSEYASALRTNLQYTLKSFNIGLQYRRIDPNYQSFGAYYFNTDLENITTNTSFRIFKKTLTLRGSIGMQRDNLKNSKASNSRRLITRFIFNYNPGNAFGINGTFGNYSINQFAGNLPLNDTIKLYQSNRNLSLIPHLTFIKENMSQVFMLNITYMDLIDLNQFTAETNQVSSFMLMLNYIRNYQSLGLNINLGLNKSYLSTSIEKKMVTGISVQIGKMVLKNKVNISLMWVNNINSTNIDSDNKGIVSIYGISAFYRPYHNHMLKCNMHFNSVNYSENISAKSYNESKIILSYVYTFRK